MKYYISLIIISVICCLSFASCGNEDEKFENIEFKTTGVTLSPLTNGISYYGEIDHAGGEITFTAIGKNADNGFLSQFKMGDYLYEITDTDLKRQLPYTICEKEWGKIEILSASPHVTRIVLFENQTHNSISYELTFGGAYKTSHVFLTQLKKE
ncbi:hypothetical protein [uncultured Alistipes sp.]|uniref:hypothetical protein n=1 Tax=uncultured Alistipes sp. TaxID=538949 RepID=UPI0025949523|nr:hypothetical protein [uncultured Alistipes sp.]